MNRFLNQWEEGGRDPHLGETFVGKGDSHPQGKDFDVEWEQMGKQFERAAVVVTQAVVAVAIEWQAGVVADSSD